MIPENLRFFNSFILSGLPQKIFKKGTTQQSAAGSKYCCTNTESGVCQQRKIQLPKFDFCHCILAQRCILMGSAVIFGQLQLFEKH